MRVPRGSESCQVAIPQCIPLAGASSVLAKGLPIITASAPHATDLQTSPPVRIPPSVTIETYRPVSLKYASRAATHSIVADTCGTPIPNTSRLVHADPGPTPTKIPCTPSSANSLVTE